MKNLFFFLLFILSGVNTSAQDQLSWLTWDCEGNTGSVYSVPVGHRMVLLKYSASWPENETRNVLKCIGGECEPLGQVSGGEHVIEVTYDNPLTNGYWETSVIVLQVSGSGEGNTEELYVTTEPEPAVLVAMEVVMEDPEGDSISVTAFSENAYNDGWGLIFPFCDSHQIVLISEVFAGETLVFQDTVVCTPGQPTLSTAGFTYKGPYTELCARSSIKRVGSLPAPEFEPYTIAISEQECLFAGDMTTSVTENSEDSPVVAFPNPCHDILFLRSDEVVSWRVTNILSSVTTTGRGKSIDTSSWPSGVYILQIEGVDLVTRIVRE